MTWDVSAFTFDYTPFETIAGVLLLVILAIKTWGIIKGFIGSHKGV